MLYTLHKNIDAVFNAGSAINHLRQIVAARIQMHLNGEYADLNKVVQLAMNDAYYPGDVFYSIEGIETKEEWITVMLALVPHIVPNFFESVIMEYLPGGGDFPEFGGVKGTNHRGMLPTGETVQFILGGTHIETRLQVQQLFAEEHFFYRKNLLWIEPVKEGEPFMSGRIVMAKEWIDTILFNKESTPRFGLDFPAKRITTQMIWNDVVLHSQTMQQVNDIKIWLEYNHLLFKDENLKRKIKPGYRVLFYGPAGTGKTLTAKLLGNQFNKDVYRIDLSQIVSKYIGETEKNLEGVFKKAESKDWILFFDEADALFGKRTNVQSSHDKYANQEVSYLLQRIEDYQGLLILASNFKNNLDEAFIRRFHALIHFPMPNSSERLTLWQKSLPSTLYLDQTINLHDISSKYELSGASILNAVQYITLRCFSTQKNTITYDNLLEGIRREYMKEEKTL